MDDHERFMAETRRRREEYILGAAHRLWEKLTLAPAAPGDLEALLEMNSPDSQQIILEGLARYDGTEDC